MSKNNNAGLLKKIGWTAAALILAGGGWLTTQEGGEEHNPAADSQSTHSSSNSQGLSKSGDTCTYESLPDEAQQQIEDILVGAPPDDGKYDGAHFGNYEELLPKQSSNYYREYTVKTPGLNHRGARRIVVGGGTETDPDVWFYTSDHYESFCTIPNADDAV